MVRDAPRLLQSVVLCCNSSATCSWSWGGLLALTSQLHNWLINTFTFAVWKLWKKTFAANDTLWTNWHILLATAATFTFFRNINSGMTDLNCVILHFVSLWRTKKRAVMFSNRGEHQSSEDFLSSVHLSSLSLSLALSLPDSYLLPASSPSPPLTSLCWPGM